MEEESQANQESQDVEAAKEKSLKTTQNGGTTCLIQMEGHSAGVISDGHDDTFTNLMHRPAPPRNSDSASGDFVLPVNSKNGNPFMGMGQPEEGDKGEQDNFQASFLPKPEEVIAIDPAKRLSKVQTADQVLLPGLTEEVEEEEEQETLLGGGDEEEIDAVFEQPKPVIRQQKSLTRQKSAADTATADQASFLLPRPKISNSACDVTDGNNDASLLQLSAISTAAPSTGHRSMSVSGLVDIDTSFTPFKKKGCDGNEAQPLPKMKIFLPQDADDDDSDDSSSSGGEDDAAAEL